jgi:hypothetical protein
MTLYVWQTTVQDALGNVQPGATVEVRNASDNTLATIYSDESGSPMVNPTDTDGDGFVRFYTEGGFYNITAETDAFSVRTWEDVLIGTPSDTSFGNVQNITLAAGNNLDITLATGAKIIRLTPDASGSIINSIDSTNSARRNIIFVNVGTADGQTVTIPHLDGSGQPGNLIFNPGGADYIIPYGDSLSLWADDTDTDIVWRRA